MKAEQMRVVKGRGNELASNYNKAMAELAEKNPRAQMIDANTFYIFYDADIEGLVAAEEPKIIEIPAPATCKDCPHFKAINDCGLFDSHVWGKCGLLGDASISGNHSICSKRRREQERKEVRLAKSKYRRKKSVAR